MDLHECVARAKARIDAGYLHPNAERPSVFHGPHQMTDCDCGAHHHHPCPKCNQLTSGTGKSFCGKCSVKKSPEVPVEEE